MNPILIYGAAAAMVVASVGLYAVVVRGNASRRPEGAVQWAATGLAAVTIAVAVLLAVITAGLGGEAAPSSPTTPLTGVPQPTAAELNAPAEDFSFRLVEGGDERSLADYEGQVVLLNIWATWCAPCLEELPALDRLQEAYRDEGLTVLTLSDEPRDELVVFLERMPLSTVAGYLPEPHRLPQPFLRALDARPTTYLIDRDGTLRQYMLGARTYDAFERVVQPYL